MNDGLTKVEKKIDEAVKKQLPIVLKLPEPDKTRSLICLAYEYFNLDMEEEAFKIIQQADPDYFKGDQLAKDMGDIQDYDKVVITIMSKLYQLGYFTTPEKKEDKK